MEFRIHFTLPNGTEDSIVVVGETIQDIQQTAIAEVANRGGTNEWSEQIG